MCRQQQLRTVRRAPRREDAHRRSGDGARPEGRTSSSWRSTRARRGSSSRDPVSGQLVGLEIDLAREIARTILGSGDDAHVQFKTVAPKEKIDFPAEGKVDIAISAISMTCDRWKEVAFSSALLRGQARLPRALRLVDPRVERPRGQARLHDQGLDVDRDPPGRRHRHRAAEPEASAGAGRSARRLPARARGGPGRRLLRSRHLPRGDDGPGPEHAHRSPGDGAGLRDRHQPRGDRIRPVRQHGARAAAGQWLVRPASTRVELGAALRRRRRSRSPAVPDAITSRPLP